MNSETRTALIELWRDVPGCRPNDDEGWHLYWDDCWGWQQPPDGCMVPMVANDGGNKIVTALARDAIVEWLNALGYEVHNWPLHEGVYRIFLDRCDRRPNPYLEVEFSGPTRLSALIAAARAVHKGAERGE